ncbi:MAG: GntR family transcriptional regulator [Parvibaculaceae bacterium]
MQKAKNDAQFVYDTLTQAIVEQSLAPETRLPEELICKQLGVSRHAVRTAFQMLAADELVVIRQNKGATVAKPSQEHGKDVLRVRIELEDVVIRSVAGKLTKENIEKLRHSVELEHQYVDKDHAAYKGQTSAFHSCLAEMAGSNILLKYLNPLLSQSSLVFYTHGRPRWTRCNSDEHTKLLDALATGDVETARRVMREHLEALYDRAFSDDKFRDEPSLEETLQRYSKKR